MVQILAGRGISVCDGVNTPVETDIALWVQAGKMHQIINTGEASIKLDSLFIPGYTAKENLERAKNAARERSD